MANNPDEIVYVHEPAEGMFISGLPARDLTQEDIDRLRPAMVAHGVASGMYRKASKQEKTEAAKQADHAEAEAETRQAAGKDIK